MSSIESSRQSWHVPDTLPTSLILYCRLHPARLPSPDELKDIALEWMSRNIPQPYHDMIAPWFMMPISQIGAFGSADLPSNLRQQHLAVADDPSTRDGIAGATHVIMVRSEGPCVATCPSLWPCVAAGLACLERFGGALVDVDTHKTVTPAPIMDLMEQFIPRAFFFVHPRIVNGNNGRATLVTYGMLHYGLPQLRIENVPPEAAEAMIWATLGIAQIVGTMALNVTVSKDGNTSTLDFPLEIGLSERDVRAIMGAPGEDAGKAVQVRLELVSNGKPEEAYIVAVPPRHCSADFTSWINDIGRLLIPAVPAIAAAAAGTVEAEEPAKDPIWRAEHFEELPEFVRRRSGPEFFRRLSLAGREMIISTQLARWRTMRSMSPRLLRASAIFSVTAVIFALAKLWVFSAIVGLVALYFLWLKWPVFFSDAGH